MDVAQTLQCALLMLQDYGVEIDMSQEEINAYSEKVVAGVKKMHEHSVEPTLYSEKNVTWDDMNKLLSTLGKAVDRAETGMLTNGLDPFPIAVRQRIFHK